MENYKELVLELTLKFALAGKKLIEFMMRLAGPIFVFLATTLITGIMVVHFQVLLPYYTPYDTFLGLLHTIWSVFVCFNMAFNYYMVVFSLPGKTPDVTEEEKIYVEDLKKIPEPKKGEGFSRYCKICKKPKPARCHHCHVCGKCVLRMDHHCPWIGNCVGFYNHRYFLLFLLYLWIGCAWVAFFSFFPFSSESPYLWKGAISKGTIIFVFVLTLSVSFAVGFLLVWHLYLALTNQTTIEFYYNKFKNSEAKTKQERYVNEFDLGWKKNWQVFFGQIKRNWWYMWCLPTTSPPPGDGIIYQTKNGFTNGIVTTAMNDQFIHV
jgi:palmitoyltransferase